MRCGCPECGAFMIHCETTPECVCPECLYRCHACLGTGTAISREEALHLRDIFSDTADKDKSKKEEER